MMCVFFYFFNKKIMEIIPAIMPKDFEEITEKARGVYSFVETIQVDIMDGKLTHSRSWPYIPGQEESFEKVTSGEIGLPLWQEVDYEADLMIQNPEEDFGIFVSAGFHRIIVHVESASKFRNILEEWNGVVEIGAGINIDTDNSVLFPIIEQGLSFVQFMGVATIGYQGGPFDRRVLEKIKSLREAYPNIIISVDGGVSLENAPLLVGAGANRLVSGSAIFGSENREEIINEFKKIT
jgi:ribulose-phosphate 3-epimerase